jgi:hypothetical protein
MYTIASLQNILRTSYEKNCVLNKKIIDAKSFDDWQQKWDYATVASLQFNQEF